MYAGEIVERASVDELFARPQHPYTVGLLGSIPRLRPSHHQRLAPIEGNSCPTAACSAVSAAVLPPSAALARLVAPSDRWMSLRERPVAADASASSAHSLQWRGGSALKAPLDCDSAGPGRDRHCFAGARGKDLVKQIFHFVANARCSGGRRRMSRRSMASASASMPARRWHWSANPVAANPPSAAWCCACSNRTRATIKFDGRDLLALDANELRAFRRDAQIIFQDPYASLNPRMTVSQMLAEPLALHDLVPAPRRRERVERIAAIWSGCEPRFARRYPHEFSGGQRQRIAHRAGACGRTEAHHLRRAGVGARRVDPVANPQPAARSAAAARACLYFRLARPCRGQAHRRPRGGDESRQHRRNARTRMSCSPRHVTPIAARCCRRSRCPGRRQSEAAWCCRARCRARSIRRPAAAFIRAVPS